MKVIIILLFMFYNLFAKNILLTKEQELYLKNKQIITMCVDPDWEPFEKINNKGVHEGIAADIIKILGASPFTLNA